MSIDPKFGRYCDECGRTIVKAHRIFENNEYCASCYPRVFISIPCTHCGKSARVHRLSQDPPVCRSCLLIGRICVRCEKPIINAGMISGGQPVCPSCVPHFKTAAQCTSCGKLSTRLSAMPSAGIFEKVCDSCRNKVTHKSCSVCHKYRKVVGVTAEGRPLCEACQPDLSITHSCPNCGVTVPGNGNAKCRACLNHLQIAQDLELSVLTLSREWVQVAYRQFAAWILERHPDKPSLIKLLRPNHAFFERLDVQFLDSTDITEQALLQTFGTAGLRRHLLATQFLEAYLSLEITAQAKSENADLERIQTKLQENRKQPWGSILVNYSELLRKDELPARTRRMYVSAAEVFCQYAKPSNKSCPESSIEHFLRKKPGLRANLSRFVGFCNRTYCWGLTMPPIDKLRAKLNGSPKTVAHLKKLLRTVVDQGVDNADQKTLARIIAKSLGFPAKEILGLTSKHLSSDSDHLILKINDESIQIPDELESITRAFIRKM